MPSVEGSRRSDRDRVFLTCDLEELNIVTKIHPSSVLSEFSDFDSMPYIKHREKRGKVHPITCHEGTERE